MSRRRHFTISLYLDAHRSRRTSIDAELETLRASPGFSAADAAARAKALAPILQRRDSLDANIVRTVDVEFVVPTHKEWIANTPTSLQRRAAMGNPSRATAVRQLAEGLLEPEQLRLAELLVAEGDAEGAFGLRQVAASAAVAALALKAGTREAHGKMVAYLLAKQGYAAAITATGADPAKRATAAHAVNTIDFEDGTVESFSDAEMDRLLDDSAA